ncbi:unnamed protein product [Closterium sp. NIES-64]|nr:unnamed protein product [Closterium sp. NIES-64]
MKEKPRQQHSRAWAQSSVRRRLEGGCAGRGAREWAARAVSATGGVEGARLELAHGMGAEGRGARPDLRRVLFGELQRLRNGCDDVSSDGGGGGMGPASSLEQEWSCIMRWQIGGGARGRGEWDSDEEAAGRWGDADGVLQLSAEEYEALLLDMQRALYEEEDGHLEAPVPSDRSKVCGIAMDACVNIMCAADGCYRWNGMGAGLSSLHGCCMCVCTAWRVCSVGAHRTGIVMHLSECKVCLGCEGVPWNTKDAFSVAVPQLFCHALVAAPLSPASTVFFQEAMVICPLCKARPLHMHGATIECSCGHFSLHTHHDHRAIANTHFSFDCSTKHSITGAVAVRRIAACALTLGGDMAACATKCASRLFHSCMSHCPHTAVQVTLERLAARLQEVPFIASNYPCALSPHPCPHTCPRPAVQVTLEHLAARLQEVTWQHAVGCPALPSFTLHRSHGVTALLAHCHACPLFEIVL